MFNVVTVGFNIRVEMTTDLLGRIKNQLSHNMTRLLRLKKLAILVDTGELGVHLGIQIGGMVLPELALHLGVDHTRPDRDGRNIGFFSTQAHSEVVHGGLGSGVKSPAAVSGDCCTGGREDDFSLGLAESRESCFGLVLLLALNLE